MAVCLSNILEHYRIHMSTYTYVLIKVDMHFQEFAQTKSSSNTKHRNSFVSNLKLVEWQVKGEFFIIEFLSLHCMNIFIQHCVLLTEWQIPFEKIHFFRFHMLQRNQNALKRQQGAFDIACLSANMREFYLHVACHNQYVHMEYMYVYR